MAEAALANVSPCPRLCTFDVGPILRRCMYDSRFTAATLACSDPTNSNSYRRTKSEYDRILPSWLGVLRLATTKS